MTEASQIYHVARRYLTTYGRLVRVENRISSEEGTPDWYYILKGQSGWLEGKMFDAEDRPRKLTLEQVRWGEVEVNWGGRWFLLGRFNAVWLLYDVVGARALLGGEISTPLLRVQGRFPTTELLRHLAPPSAILGAAPPPRNFGSGAVGS